MKNQYSSTMLVKRSEEYFLKLLIVSREMEITPVSFDWKQGYSLLESILKIVHLKILLLDFKVM